MSVGRSVIVGLSLGLLVFQSVCWSGLSIWGVDRSIGLSVCLLVWSTSRSVCRSFSLSVGLVSRATCWSGLLVGWSVGLLLVVGPPSSGYPSPLELSGS